MGKDWMPKSSSSISTPAARAHGSSPKPNAKATTGVWRLFGYCHIHELEWGYLMLSELASLRLPFRLTIERDIYTAKKYVRDFLPQDE